MRIQTKILRPAYTQQFQDQDKEHFVRQAILIDGAWFAFWDRAKTDNSWLVGRGRFARRIGNEGLPAEHSWFSPIHRWQQAGCSGSRQLHVHQRVVWMTRFLCTGSTLGCHKGAHSISSRNCGPMGLCSAVVTALIRSVTVAPLHIKGDKSCSRSSNMNGYEDVCTYWTPQQNVAVVFVRPEM